ncbi:MAG: L-serine ammonia-lyase, iron-sulfur-dependent, subunit alpha [Firmicutes bacterium]|nr:L-serine ammonia-lyase, iron-sulfur-dependent, subunit alpha [Bacillota bacterium]
MKRQHYPSIFNDVLAPVTQGPSSSNTVGPFRIGTVARALLKGEPRALKIKMSTGGGYFATFYNMDSDKGFLAGILGKDLIGDDLSRVYEDAKEAGLEYEFKFRDDVPSVPSELAVLTVMSDLEELNMRCVSLGGGEILINELDGKPCHIKGIYEEEIEVKGETRTVTSVYPLRVDPKAEPPFRSSAEMLAYAKKQSKALWEAAVDYEMSLTGLSTEEVLDVAEKTLRTAYRAIERGFEPGVEFEGVTVAKAPEIKEKIKTVPLIPTGVGDKGGLEALAMMEYSNAHGIIVCMPTGGAAGIIPAAIRSASESLGKSREDEVKALLTAGLTGVFYYPTHYHGALGCQAEVGIATSQAAAALASYITDDPEAVERAAVLAMQYLLGQVCDPIEGYPQVPCFIRNVASVPVAAACANYGVLGLDTSVSLDEMVKAVLRVGEALRERRINDLGTCACCYKANPLSTAGKNDPEEQK